MVRSIVRLHTIILVISGLTLLVIPGPILAAFGVSDPTFPVMALSRILAGLIIVLAAAVSPFPQLPTPTRGYALTSIAAAYALLTALCLMQQVAIWSSVAGALLSAELVLHTAAFAWLAATERRSVAVGDSGVRRQQE
jgi:hypothetical protein